MQKPDSMIFSRYPKGMITPAVSIRRAVVWLVISTWVGVGGCSRTSRQTIDAGLPSFVAGCIDVLSESADLPVESLAGCENMTRHIVYRAGPSGPIVAAYSNRSVDDASCIVIPHEDERTAFRVAVAHVAGSGGQLFTIEQGGHRNVVFERDGVRITVDPNRIFTDVGLRATVQKLNSDLPEGWDDPAALSSLMSFAQSFLDTLDTCLSQMPGPPTVIAIHNNRNSTEPTDFSIESYLNDGGLAGDAARIQNNPTVHDELDRDAFFLVTHRDDFDRLRPRWNVVLQSPQATDDGSLSVHYKDRRYINVEAQHGWFDQQVTMLNAALR